MKKVHIHKATLLLLALCFLFSACKDFIEPSINNRQVTLQAPAEGYQSTKYALNFWWDEVQDALSYRLQIVSNNFNAPGRLIIDTLITSHTFTFNIDPGDYQWRVSAANGSTATSYSQNRSFSVLYSSIKQQSVQLKTPANELITNKALTTFQWSSLYGATKYHIQIDTNNFANESALVYSQTVPGLQVNFSLPKDMTYQWRVMAENDTAQARWSGIKQLTYDHTPPGLVTLTAPINRQAVTGPVNLQWQAVPDVAKYRLYVLKSDSTSTYNATYPIILTTTNYSFSAALNGERIYWKVSAIDAAGNEGNAGLPRSFTVR
jgi:hypothetical protein